MLSIAFREKCRKEINDVMGIDLISRNSYRIMSICGPIKIYGFDSIISRFGAFFAPLPPRVNFDFAIVFSRIVDMFSVRSSENLKRREIREVAVPWFWRTLHFVAKVNNLIN